MAKKVNLQNTTTNKIKEVNIGFNVWLFLFGVFYLLVKKEWKSAGIMLLIAIVIATILNVAGPLASLQSISGIVLGLVYGFGYGKYHVKDLLNQGYVAIDEESRILIAREINKDSALK